MKPRGRRVAIAAAVLGLATLAATGFILRERVLEEWNIHRFRTGDDRSKQAALEWMGEHGREASWISLAELLSRVELSRNQREFARWGFVMGVAVNDIGKRLGQERLEASITKLLDQNTSTPEHLVLVAALVIQGDHSQFQPRTFELAIRRLRESLSSPNPMIRMAAVNTLAEAGERARAVVPALQPLKNDPDQEVRKAAAEAIERLSAIPQVDDSPR